MGKCSTLAIGPSDAPWAALAHEYIARRYGNHADVLRGRGVLRALVSPPNDRGVVRENVDIAIRMHEVAGVELLLPDVPRRRIRVGNRTYSGVHDLAEAAAEQLRQDYRVVTAIQQLALVQTVPRRQVRDVAAGCIDFRFVEAVQRFLGQFEGRIHFPTGAGVCGHFHRESKMHRRNQLAIAHLGAFSQQVNVYSQVDMLHLLFHEQCAGLGFEDGTVGLREQIQYIRGMLRTKRVQQVIARPGRAVRAYFLRLDGVTMFIANIPAVPAG